MGELPTFIVIGAGKSGTTALNSYLSKHPQVFMSPLKEPCYFCNGDINLSINRSAIRTLEGYLRLFKDVQDETAIGEVSPQYLSRVNTPSNIYNLIPDVRLIAVLRNPVERAFSLYTHFRRDGHETERDFLTAVNSSALAWHYVDEGMYSVSLSQYFSVFESSQILILLYDELRDETEQTLNKVYRFLGVDTIPWQGINSEKNISGLPQNPILGLILKTFSKPKMRAALRTYLPNTVRSYALEYLNVWMGRDLKRVVMSGTEKSELINIFRDDILRLELQLHRDLSGWLV